MGTEIPKVEYTPDEAGPSYGILQDKGVCGQGKGRGS